MEPLNVWDYEQLAADSLEPGAHGYYAGGAGDELTLRDNVEAFRRWQLRPRMLVNVETCTTATTVLGQEISMPLLVAPVAFQRVAHPDGEVAMARAALAARTIGVTRRLRHRLRPRSQPQVRSAGSSSTSSATRA